MAPFYADLHLHSKYSLATSRDADLEHLSLWARKKGLALLATGDFTHPAWLGELKDKLVPAEPGLFRLRPEIERQLEERLGGAAGAPTRFLLEVEISTIYKKAGHTRKVHHLVYVPSLAAADVLVERLERIGNLASDGRPILGLDSRDLLEIVLGCDDGAYLVPAHIWTPWFAVLGSKSGFDSVEECYGDLASHIFAVETGLSSDPPMNWRLSALDRYTLVSNSDAHSPPKLGREACVFDTELDYFALRRALETGSGFAGTVEFFPDEGKYHLDGHRKCGVRLSPSETRQREGHCPACGKPVTVGVMHRVELLADRPEDERPARTDPFSSLLPLHEVLAELEGVGAQSRRVRSAYEAVVSRLGGELHLLRDAPLEEVKRHSILLAEALARMRSGEVHREAGYDGEYGVIRLFESGELRRKSAAALLFEIADGRDDAEPSLAEEVSPAGTAARRAEPGVTADAPRTDAVPLEPEPAQRGLFEHERAGHFLAALDPEQRAAAAIAEGPLLILAGPGTGKTRTLTHRLAHLVGELGVESRACLALTFTRRAAREMRERLDALLGARGRAIQVLTFHALGYRMVSEHAALLGLPEQVTVADEATAVRVLAASLGLEPAAARRRLAGISRTGRGEPEPGQEPDAAANAEGRDLELYRAALHEQGLVDLDELIELPVRLLEQQPEIAARYRQRFRYLSVDETQDLDTLQYRLLRLLCRAPGGPAGAADLSNVCAIGDPDQSIYGFRGADPSVFERFRQDFPGLRTVRLARNYRSERTIVEAALQVISRSHRVRERGLEAQRDGRSRIAVHTAASADAEAEWVVHQIEQLLGGHSFYSLDSGRAEGDPDAHYGFSDFAVLYRIDAQADALAAAFERSGMPYQRRSHRRLGRELAQWLDSLGSLTLESPANTEQAHGGTLRRRLESAIARLPEDRRPRALGRGDWLLELADRVDEEAGSDLQQLLAQLAVGVEVDSWDPRAHRISLLTLHAAKGLEFPVVFLVGCEDGLLPLRLPGERRAGSEPDLEEERRLFFVGMTRAKERLFLSRARERNLWGRMTEPRPSPFLADIEQRLIEATDAERRRRKPPRARQLRLL